MVNGSKETAFSKHNKEDAIRTHGDRKSMHEICRSSSYTKPQDREGEVGTKVPLAKKLFIIVIAKAEGKSVVFSNGVTLGISTTLHV